MKVLFIFSSVFLLTISAIGQKPDTFIYQVSVRNAKGDPVAEKPVTARLSILAGNPTGLTVFSEIHSAVTNREGLLSLEVGNGSARSGSLSTIEWEAENFFLKIEVDTEGGINYKEISTTQIINIPAGPAKKSSKRSTEVVIEDEFLVTRRFVGTFLEFRHTGPDTFDGPNIIWIKTTLDKKYGKLSAYGKTCDFQSGDNLYIRRIFYSPGDVSGYWIYQIENDSSVYYRLSEFQYDKKVYVETLFLNGGAL